MARITRQKKLNETTELVVEREALGQVADYTVYEVTTATGARKRIDSDGSKRGADKVFNRTTTASV